MKTFEYRVYTNKDQEKRLLACLADSRGIYNEMLETVKKHYVATGKLLSRYDLNRQFKGRSGEHVPASTVQCLDDRLDKALHRYSSLKQLGRKVGFPRFKSANHWRSIQLRQYGRGKDAEVANSGKHIRVPAKIGKNIRLTAYPERARTWRSLR